jgi:hypothetical protein
MINNYIVKFVNDEPLYKTQQQDITELIIHMFEYKNCKLTPFQNKIFHFCVDIKELIEYYNDLDNEENPIELIINIDTKDIIYIDQYNFNKI